jgi:hypothetical protein
MKMKRIMNACWIFNHALRAARTISIMTNISSIREQTHYTLAKLIISKVNPLISKVKEICFIIALIIFSLIFYPVLLITPIIPSKVKGVFLKYSFLKLSLPIIKDIKHLNLVLKVQILFYSLNFNLILFSILMPFQGYLLDPINSPSLIDFTNLVLLNYGLMELAPSSFILNGDVLTFDPMIYMSSGTGNGSSSLLSLYAHSNGDSIYHIHIGPGGTHSKWTITFGTVQTTTEANSLVNFHQRDLILANPLPSENPVDALYNELNNLALQAENSPQNSASYACQIARKSRYSHVGFSLGKEVYNTAPASEKLAMLLNPETLMYTQDYDADSVADWSNSVKEDKTRENILRVYRHLENITAQAISTQEDTDNFRRQTIAQIERALL